MVNTGNLRMLSVYYSAQNLYKNDLAEPLLRAIRPLINVQPQNLSLLVEKVMSNLKYKIEFKKLEEKISNNFAKIDSGRIRPNTFLGHQMEVDEIVDSSLHHDVYFTIYKGCLKELSMLRYECAVHVREEFTKRIGHEEIGLSQREKVMMQNAINNFRRRPPISLDMEVMKNIIEMMHDCIMHSCDLNIADTTLSTAILKADRKIKSCSVQDFI